MINLGYGHVNNEMLNSSYIQRVINNGAKEIDFSNYSTPGGKKETRRAIAKYFSLPSEEYCCVSVSSCLSFHILHNFLFSKKKIMFFTPIFQNYFQQLKRLPQERLLQREISDLKKIDFSELEKGDLCLLINPNNPTGHVFSLTEIEEMLIRIKKRKAIAVLDISWINTVFEKQNIFSKDDIGKLVIKYDMILLAGFTKMFGLTGIRCSGFIANPTLVKEFIKIHTEVSISCGSLDEYMVKKFMQKFPIDWKKATKELNELKEYTIFLLKKLKTNFKIIKPKAGVFLYLYSETINDSEIIAKECLKRGVLLYPSTIFEDKKNGVRICFAESKENLKKGIEIFGDVLA